MPRYGLRHHIAFGILPLVEGASAAAHLLLLNMCFASKFTEEIRQRVRVLRWAQISADTVLHRLAAAGDIAGYKRSARCSGLKQYI